MRSKLPTSRGGGYRTESSSVERIIAVATFAVLAMSLEFDMVSNRMERLGRTIHQERTPDGPARVFVPATEPEARSEYLIVRIRPEFVNTTKPCSSS